MQPQLLGRSRLRPASRSRGAVPVLVLLRDGARAGQGRWRCPLTPPPLHLGHEPDSLLPPRWRTACQRRRVPEASITLDADLVTCTNCRRSKWWPILVAMGPGAEPTWRETARLWWLARGAR